MEASGRLIKQIDCLPCVSLGKLSGQFDSLAFTARQGCRRLSESNIAKTYILKSAQLVIDRRDALEELSRHVDGHLQHVTDRLALEFDLKRLPIIPLTSAIGTLNHHIGQKTHLNNLNASPFTSLTTSSAYIERETTTLVVSEFRLGQLCVDLPDVIKHTSICGRI